jgi:hypothetical protein
MDRRVATLTLATRRFGGGPRPADPLRAAMSASAGCGHDLLAKLRVTGDEPGSEAEPMASCSSALTGHRPRPLDPGRARSMPDSAAGPGASAAAGDDSDRSGSAAGFARASNMGRGPLGRPAVRPLASGCPSQPVPANASLSLLPPVSHHVSPVPMGSKSR